MKTYGRIASLPHDWLQMQKLHESMNIFCKALAKTGVRADVAEWNLMAANKHLFKVKP